MSTVASTLSPAIHSSRRNEALYIVDSFKSLRWKDSLEFRKVAVDHSTLADWTDKFLRLQDSFRRDGKPILVEIAYHYTTKDRLHGIERSGLRASKCRRYFFGHGIYVANNPQAFRAYGDTGIIVLLIRGIQRWCLNNEERSVDTEADTFSGNKIYDAMDKSNFTRSTYFDEIVPRNNDQVLPLLMYNRELTNNNDLMWRNHVLLQTWVNVTFCQDGLACWPSRWMPCMDDIQFEHKIAQNHALSSRSNSKRLKVNPNLFFAASQTVQHASAQAKASQSKQKLPTTPTFLGQECCIPAQLKTEKISSCSFTRVFKPNESCPICLDSLSENAVALNNCKHCFHQDCLTKALSIKKECPICRQQAGEPRGACPRGRMFLSLHHDLYCHGFRTKKIPTILITYHIYPGRQSDEHENPGEKFSGTERKAFLPYNTDGKNLAKRLRYAFRRGLTFRVGTSLTTGKSNTVCWASIHHKTSTKKSTYGWPDSSYFMRVNWELDQLKVPKADQLE